MDLMDPSREFLAAIRAARDLTRRGSL